MRNGRCPNFALRMRRKNILQVHTRSQQQLTQEKTSKEKETTNKTTHTKGAPALGAKDCQKNLKSNPKQMKPEAAEAWPL
jgi:hypothetical protein